MYLQYKKYAAGGTIETIHQGVSLLIRRLSHPADTSIAIVAIVDCKSLERMSQCGMVEIDVPATSV